MKKTLKDKLIDEAMDFYRIDSLLDDEDFDMGEDEDMDFDFDDEDFDDEMGEENPDKAGMIRPVKGAYLVYKRVTPNNNYEELWVYNLGNVKSQTRIRNSILAGTDIDPVDLRSPDNEQSATTWSKGNVQYLHIDGLPN
jgi:hypothetical protein